MKKIFILIFFALSFIGVKAQIKIETLRTKGFPIVTQKEKAIVLYDTKDPVSIKKTVDLFCDDVQRVTGKRLLSYNETHNCKDNFAIIVGTFSGNQLIQKLIGKRKIDTTGLTTGWEQYRIQRIKNPAKGIKEAIVIAGSDRRGAAYGLLSISEIIGVNPWYWWLDAPIKKHNQLILSISPFTSQRPSVKYRGIFINDEDWGLFPWVKKNFDKELGNFGPKTYSKVCELLLRLKANYLCPAMHNCSLAFHKLPENRLVADSFAIVMGTSHCEPLMLNTATEWDSKKYGEWDYANNKHGIDSVLKSRVKECAPFENVWTLALRGLHDVAMKASNNMNERKNLMQEALYAQRKILEDILKKDANTIPQAFTPYKEVLDVYDEGLKLPDDVTIIWPDDNYGYMKRLSSPIERMRSGRSGVYYHASYLGRPHNYLWMNTTSPVLMYEELRKAYDTTADRIWLLNAGDIKSCEFAVDFFLSLAYDINSFNYPRVSTYRTEWLCKMLDKKYEKQYHDIFTSFYNLAFQRKPECMGWGYQWTSDIKGREINADTEFSFTNYREAERRINEYIRIGRIADKLYKEIPESQKACFFEALYYPVKGCELLNRSILLGQKNRWYAWQKRAGTSMIEQESKTCNDSLDIITKSYNQMLNGKWNYVITRRQNNAAAYFEKPELHQALLMKQARMGINVENEAVMKTRSNWHQLPNFNKYLPRTHYIDIYNMGEQDFSWTADPSDPWILLNKKKGIVKTEDRLMVSIDWEKAPQGEQILGSINIIANNGQQEKILISVFNPVQPNIQDLDSLFIETNGYISIDAAHFNKKHENHDIKINIIPNLGIEGSVVQLGNPIAPAHHTNWKNAPYVEYDFYCFTQGPVDVYTYVLPTFTLSKDRGFAGHEMTNIETHYGVAIDDVPILPGSTSSFEYAENWYESVLRNARINKCTLQIKKPGRHTLKIIGGDAGTLLQKIVIDFGGLQHSYMGPQPTRK